MNKERMLALADHLEKPETAEHFDMFDYLQFPGTAKTFGEAINNCGTMACCAGHAVALFAPETPIRSRYVRYPDPNPADMARSLLGLTSDQATSLFHRGLGRNNKEAAADIRAMVASS